MTKTLKILLILAVVVITGLAHIAKAQDAKSSGPAVYSVLNDDVPLGYDGHFNSGSVFVNGVYTSKINTDSYGIGGGYLGIHNTDIDVVDGQNECIFLS